MFNVAFLQVYRKAVKKGFEFTLMVAGEAGMGKSTLINSMFLTDIYSAEYPGPSARIKKTVKVRAFIERLRWPTLDNDAVLFFVAFQVDTNKVLLKESGVNLTLTIVDTPGFGDAVDNSGCWDPVIQYVESQYEAFLDAETRVNRVALPDTRFDHALECVRQRSSLSWSLPQGARMPVLHCANRAWTEATGC